MLPTPRPEHDLELVARRWIATTHFPDEPLRPLYLQPDRAVYLLEAADVVIKVYADQDLLQRDWETTQLARGVGVPTPDAIDFVHGSPALYAMRRARGRPLATGDAAAQEAGAVLARLHSLAAQPLFPSGARRWDEHVANLANYCLAELDPYHIFTVAELAWLRSSIVSRHDLLVERPIVLLHGDLQPAHILVDTRGERVVAFLDFADAHPGDPLVDVAILTLNDPQLVVPLLNGYGRFLDDERTPDLLALYRLLRHVGSISWLLARGFHVLAAREIAAVRAVLPG